MFNTCINETNWLLKLNDSFILWTNETVVDKCLQFADERNESDGMKAKVTLY